MFFSVVVMDFTMFRICKKLKVFDFVMQLIKINMMNDFRRKQRTAKMFRHHNSTSFNPFAILQDPCISPEQKNIIFNIYRILIVTTAGCSSIHLNSVIMFGTKATTTALVGVYNIIAGINLTREGLFSNRILAFSRTIDLVSVTSLKKYATGAAISWLYRLFAFTRINGMFSHHA